MIYLPARNTRYIIACLVVWPLLLCDSQIAVVQGAQNIFNLNFAISIPLIQDGDEDEDEDEDEGNVNALANFGTTKAKVLGAKKFLLEQEFAIAVDEVIEVCDVSDSQLRKLKVATRGAIKKSMEKWKKEGLRQLGMANFGNVPNEDDEDEDEVTPEVFTDADDIDMQTMQLVGGMIFNPFNYEAPTESKFWKKALRASIGEQEYEKLVDYREAREERRHEKAVAASVEELSCDLRLSAGKKQAFSDLVAPKMLKGNIKRVGPMYKEYVMIYYASRASKSKLKKVLSKAQMEKWKSIVGPAKAYGQMVEMQNRQNNDDGDDDEGVARERVRADGKSVFNLPGGEFFEVLGVVAGKLVDFVEGVVGR